uniref:Extensin-like n=1 Tax=Oryza sativa subsp. japonica TaxID=39947 RepID=Q67VV2_ORYSJ|nr:extensin-like [Oryza sativa Japonica Group]BAD37717.1 extensin-like [Oryza sativa Japonica Group]
MKVTFDGSYRMLSSKIRPASPLLSILLHFSTLSPSLSPLTSLDTRHPHIHTPSTRSGGGIRLHARVVATTGRFILRLQTGGRRRLPRPTSDHRPPDLAYGARIRPPRPLPLPPATSPPPVASSYATPPPPARSGGSRLHRGLSPTMDPAPLHRRSPPPPPPHRCLPDSAVAASTTPPTVGSGGLYPRPPASSTVSSTR